MNGRRVHTKRTPVASPPMRPQMHNGSAADNQEPTLLTLTEAAQLLGHAHRTTIMRWVKEGRLSCIRLSRKAILFELAEIERFIREHRYSGH